jgi:V8-like Glu-specific endopeptidase
VLYKNTLKDIAIVVPDKELSIKAKSVKVNSKADLLGEAVNYTGFPSNIGRSTYTGFVANSDEDKMIMQSFALPGSSGSVVFDKKGRVLGVVSAVSVNQTALSPYPEIIEAVVFVERVKFLDKRFLKEVFMSAERNRHQK